MIELGILGHSWAEHGLEYYNREIGTKLVAQLNIVIRELLWGSFFFRQDIVSPQCTCANSSKQ